MGVGGGISTCVIGQIRSDRAVFRLRVDDEIPGGRAGSHVEADRRPTRARCTDTNRIGPKEFLVSAMRRDKSVRMREYESDKACFRDHAAVKADRAAMGRMPDSDEPQPVCLGQSDSFIGGAPTDDKSESVVTVERAGARASGFESEMGLGVQRARSQTCEIVGQSGYAMGVDTP